MNPRFEREKPAYLQSRASLVWLPAERETYYDKPHDSYCMFRRQLLLEDPSCGEIKIFADSRYLLYVNGREAATGPCRSDPRWQYYDMIDVAPYLKKGVNTFAVLVLFWGYGNGQSVSRVPALFLDGIFTDGEKTVSLLSDRTWKCRKLTAHDPDAPRINGCKGRAEFFDAERYDEGWTDEEHDDSGWSPCHCRSVIDSPFWNLLPRPIENLTRRTADAGKCFLCGKGILPERYDIPHLHLQIMEELDGIDGKFSPSEASFPIKTEGGEAPDILYADFGGIRVGTLFVEAVGHKGDIIDCVYAERIPGGIPRFDGISYRPITRFTLKEGKNRLPVFFAYEAFRYVFFLVRSAEGVTLERVSVETREYPFGKTAHFSCENEKLNRLWDLSARTLTVCMQDGYLDSPSREQQQWMGDGRYQAIMNYYFCGDSSMTEKLLLQIAQSQDREGMTASRYPDENHNLAPIPTYCLQWLCAFRDHYRLTGKKDLILSCYNGILLAIRWFSGFEGEDGLLYDLPYWNYCDMGINDLGRQGDFYRGGATAFPNMLYIEAMSSVILAAELAADREAETFFRQKREKLISAVREKLWDGKKGCYADALTGDGLSDSVSETVNALALINFEEGERAESICRAVFDPETKGEHIVACSVYSMILLSRALKAAHREALSVRLFLERFEPMLASDTDTLWEHWWLSSEDRITGKISYASACHAWGAAAIVLCAENICGIDGRKVRETVPPEIETLTGRVNAELFLPYGGTVKYRNGKITAPEAPMRQK